MALLSQYVGRRSLLVICASALGGGISGAGGAIAALLPFIGSKGFALGGIVTNRRHSTHEHPLRRLIIETLEASPGLCYRELQKRLDAANGTLRHHLDVLYRQHSITVLRVNGRSCHYAGAPGQIEILTSLAVGDDERAAELMPVGLSEAQRLIVSELNIRKHPRSQAELARRIGRTRATVHSAVKVLRQRGIIAADRLRLAPHLAGLLPDDGDEFLNPGSRSIDYEWSDERKPTAAV